MKRFNFILLILAYLVTGFNPINAIQPIDTVSSKDKKEFVSTQSIINDQSKKIFTWHTIKNEQFKMFTGIKLADIHLLRFLAYYTIIYTPSSFFYNAFINILLTFSSPSSSLSTEEQQEIFSILQQLGLKPEKYQIMSSASDISPAFVVGNTIYINPAFYRKLTLEEKKFIIGHEMTHILKNHGRRLLLVNLAVPLVIYGGIKLCDIMLQKFLSKDHTIKKFNDYCLYPMIYWLGICLLRSINAQSCEKEADLIAAKKLHCALGGVSLFKKFRDAKSSSLTVKDKIIKTLYILSLPRNGISHPSLNKRIKYLDKLAQQQATAQAA